MCPKNQGYNRSIILKQKMQTPYAMIVTRLPNMMDMQRIKVIGAFLGVHKLNAGYDLWLFPTSRCPGQ
jgi:hypothetical protein